MKTQLLLLLLFSFSFAVHAQIKFPKGDIYKHDSGQKISIPNRSLAFVDAVDSISFFIKKETLSLIGEPNFNPDRKQRTSIFLPSNESIVVRFINNQIRNVKGKDICVFNVGEMKNVALSVEKGKGKGIWLPIGTVSDSNPCLFLEDTISDSTSFTRLKLTNNSPLSMCIDAIAAVGVSKELVLRKLKLEEYNIFTSNTYVTIKFKDYRQWDGDRIKITVNGETVIRKTFLSIWWKKIKIALNEGENSINITALNNGYIHPNTVKLRIYDGDKRYDTLLRLRKRTQKTIFVERG